MTFFAPPRRVETTVFTRLPDRFRNPRRTAWAEANQGGRPIDCFLEGPSFDRQGRLYVTDIPYGRIFRVSAEGEWEQVAEYDGWPNGLKIHSDGRVFITDYKRGIMLLDPASGTVTSFLETAASESFKGVNDLVFAPSGNLYFTDQGQTGMHDPTGRVWKLTPEGRLTCLVNTIPSPNGIVVDPEESFLLVAVTRANQNLARAAAGERADHQSRHFRPSPRRARRTRRAGARCRRQPADLPYGVRLDLAAVAGSRAARPHRFLCRGGDHQPGLWRSRTAEPIHHREPDRNVAAGPIGDARATDVLARRVGFQPPRRHASKDCAGWGRTCPSMIFTCERQE